MSWAPPPPSKNGSFGKPRFFDPQTERLFRDAGIGPGQGVLDVGSGVGDVAMLAARLVGPSGSITCVERDPTCLSRARSRAAEAGLSNVSLFEGNAENVTSDGAFDAAVSRLVLQYVPNPAAVVQSLVALVRGDAGGVSAAHRRLAAILAANVGGREHRVGNVRQPSQRQLPSKTVNSVVTQGGLQDAAGRARAKRACKGRQRASFRPAALRSRISWSQYSR